MQGNAEETEEWLSAILVSIIRFIERRPWMFLVLCCAALTVLWLPGLRYPVVSDTANYAKLGFSMWNDHRYAISGVPYAAHLPLHALLSIPFTAAFGINLGMHLLSLVGGWATLAFSFLLLRRASSTAVAALTTVFVLVHPGFILMSMLGSADLTFTALILFSLWAYLKTGDNRRWYIGLGIGLGFAALTRYNGVPFFPLLFVWTIFTRSKDLRSGWFWSGIVIGAAIASTWFIRNYLVFGDPLHTVYAAELAQESDGKLLQIWSNILYYGNPLHNVFLLLPFAVGGIVLQLRRQSFLFAAMLCAWLLTAVWWVQAMRFAFPGYPILLGFAAIGVLALWERMRFKGILVTTIAIGCVVHAGLICAYTYGQCNAFIDRHTDILPKNLGLTPEGFEAWAQARDWINENAPQNAVILTPGADFELQPEEGVFRSDLKLVEYGSAECPASMITQHPSEGDLVLFSTEDHPITSVVVQPCNPQS